MAANGGLPDVQPNPPAWALKAGLPPPTETETLHEYCDRIGVDYGRLTKDLTPKTMANVHIRFVHLLAERCPDAWLKHVDEFVGKHRTRQQPVSPPFPFRY